MKTFSLSGLAQSTDLKIDPRRYLRFLDPSAPAARSTPITARDTGEFIATGRTQLIPGLGATWKPVWPNGTCSKVNITEVRPNVGDGRYPVKRVVGDKLRVSADVIKDGLDQLRAELRYRAPGEKNWRSAPMAYSSNDDAWYGEIPLEHMGAYEYTVSAHTDRFATFCDEVRRKLNDGQDVGSELLEGRQLVHDAIKRAAPADRTKLERYAGRLGDAEQKDAVAIFCSDELRGLMRPYELPEDLSIHEPILRVIVDRERAQFGAWYELFPRSYGPEPGVHGTFADAAKRLPMIKEMGFDVVYLPPIHPIGETNRKGKNNSLVAAPNDPGSPWAIGSKHGGHDAVHPQLGALEDFEAFVTKARDSGLEIALDFAVQCSPDHPYVKDHPEWFKRRPDGTIKYAENPPKKYQDIVALNMWSKDAPKLWNELRRIVYGWIDRGVKIFRVDNPHTKPPAFWEWLIQDVRKNHPDVIFLAEAFTSPKKLEHLAKVGFSQSYTYFTWRNSRQELEQYVHELACTDRKEFLRPNFFANTPDILPGFLQGARPAAFKLRYALAGTLSPTCGVYSGYELCENKAVRPNSEEYEDSEKYELKQRNFDVPENISRYITSINKIRNENPALRRIDCTLQNADNPNIFSFSKVSEDGQNEILVVANLDRDNPQQAMVHLQAGSFGLGPETQYKVHDLVTGSVSDWKGLSNHVQLSADGDPVRIFRIEKQ